MLLPSFCDCSPSSGWDIASVGGFFFAAFFGGATGGCCTCGGTTGNVLGMRAELMGMNKDDGPVGVT